MQEAPIRLTGILARRRLSLHQLRGLTPGALLPLPQSVLDEAWVETAQGQLLARGRLGEKDGFHAIRLRDAGQHGAAADPGADGWRAGCTALHQDPPQPAGADLPPADLDDPDAFRTAQSMPPLAKPG
ncbi:FliM/FliN family flagellar motor C-terminal domain-containing protein [Paracoccus thiocyanatus]|uniref:FliM/FliN family flagellar motor C-terminal domain-containing protein n=1 Tax=Paracoccus thiocyanatus TaxID=34006 RepID=UPI0015F29A92|nr:FliM/FliN family flagellar motor C-terminal domain-containing protein [Paracoccus thiocyanatus]